MIKSVHIKVAYAVLFTLILFACAGKKEIPVGDRKLKIVTTTGMIKDAVEHVVGDKAEVIALMVAVTADVLHA